MADEGTLAELKANNSYLTSQEWDSVIKSRGDIGGPNNEYDDAGLPVKSLYGSIGQFNEDVNKLRQFKAVEELREKILKTNPYQSRTSDPFD